VSSRLQHLRTVPSPICIAIVSNATERLFSHRHIVSFEDDPVAQCVLLFRAASRLLQLQGDEVVRFGLEMVGDVGTRAGAPHDRQVL
jgi:hypothetical protein